MVALNTFDLSACAPQRREYGDSPSARPSRRFAERSPAARIATLRDSRSLFRFFPFLDAALNVCV